MTDIRLNEKTKIGIFADSHYSSAELTCGNRKNSMSLHKLKLVYEEMCECDIIVCLGDLTDREDEHETAKENLREISDLLKSTGKPIVCVPGNHDTFEFNRDEFSLVSGLITAPAVIRAGSRLLIFLDACYHTDGQPYSPDGDHDWTDSMLSETGSLAKELEAHNGEALVFVHQCLDPNVESRHIISNASEVREILECSGKVHTVFEGHYHPGAENTVNGIKYITIPALCCLDNNYFRLFEI